MILQLQCLTEALKAQNIPFSIQDSNGNLIKVKLNQQIYFFQKSVTSLNSEVAASVCLDKEFSYNLLHQYISMPKTQGFCDWQCIDKYPDYVHYKTEAAVLEAIAFNFHYPLVIKKNRGALSNQVYLCSTGEESRAALSAIFDRNTHQYDYVALAQEYIPIAKEYRAVFFNAKLILAYERYSPSNGFNAAYWTHPGGKALHVLDKQTLNTLEAFAQPVFQQLSLGFVGMDIIQDQTGALFLLELNSAPKFNHFIEHNGKEPVIEMYMKVLDSLLDEASLPHNAHNDALVQS